MDRSGAGCWIVFSRYSGKTMTINDPNPSDQDFAQAAARLSELREALAGAIIGQESLIDGLVIAVLAGGHVLLEGLPGLGKTHLVKALAGAIGLELDRVQCTPDLMPADITGSEILARDKQGIHHFEFRKGPVFTNLLLVDEINRATPKTQAALLEAMQEGQVTHAGRRYPLPRPFWVVATQNPIEIEGTYPLPEAQLDRFAVKLRVEFPDADSLLDMLEVSLDEEPADRITPVLNAAGMSHLMGLARSVVVAPPLKRAAVDLILATHRETALGSGAAAHLRYGASPRGLQALLRAARVRALMAGRAHVSPTDLEAVALPCLRHRVLLTIDAELAGKSSDALLNRILETWRRSL
jgi:MoxR-like ATPase